MIQQYIITYLTAALLLFAPLARGSVQGWAIGGIFLIALTITVFLLCRKNAIFLSTPLNKPIVALLALSANSFIFSVNYYTSIIAVGQLLSLLLVYYSVVQIVQKRSELLFLFYWITGISTLLCCIALAKRYELNPFPYWDYSNLTYPQVWLTATFGNHNHLAGWLEMTMPLLLCSVLFSRHKKWLTLKIPLLILQVSCLILTFSRGGYAGTTAAVAFILIWKCSHQERRHNTTLVLFCLTTLILGGIFLFITPVVERINTVTSGGFETRGLVDRVLIWRGTMDMILANWLTGSGPGTYSLAFPAFQPPGFSHRYYFAHNDYLQFTAELGVFLPILMIWAVIMVYRSGLQSVQHANRLTCTVTLGSLAGITAILIHSAVDFNLHIPANALLFSVLLALSVYSASDIR